MKKIDRQIEAMTKRLVTCPIEQFHVVQKELFTLQRKAAQQKMHPTLGESAASDSESKPAPKRVI